MLLTVVVFIVPLHSAFVLVAMFVLGIVFFVFSVSCSWFCIMLKKLYFIVPSCCFCVVTLVLAACSVRYSYSLLFSSVLWDEYVENW